MNRCRNSGTVMANTTEKIKTRGVGSNHHVELELAGYAIFELARLCMNVVSGMVPSCAKSPGHTIDVHKLEEQLKLVTIAAD